MCAYSEIRKKKIHLSEIYDKYWESYVVSKDRKLWLLPKHFEAVNKARVCGTPQLGIAVLSCKGCGDTSTISRSCKHRFCARCGNADTNKWARSTLSRLINAKHHHVVTTLPKSLRHIAKKNGTVVYDLLFRVSAEILKSWFKSKHALLPGIVSVLHTAGSDLKYHPHIHMLVLGGGKEIGGEKYKILESDYLCDQQFLGRQLKIKFCQGLIGLYKQKKLKVSARHTQGDTFISWLLGLKEDQWIVSVQKPLDDVEQIVGYVGRYTKRACISEYKIESIFPTIIFRYNDYANSSRGEKAVESIKEMDPNTFLDALLLHVPDKGYRMIRYFGLYNSKYLSKIPSELRLKPLDILSTDTEYLAGKEFALYRSAFVKSGQADPLYCAFCKQDKVLVGIEYEDKYIDLTLEYEDSS